MEITYIIEKIQEMELLYHNESGFIEYISANEDELPCSKDVRFRCEAIETIVEDLGIKFFAHSIDRIYNYEIYLSKEDVEEYEKEYSDKGASSEYLIMKMQYLNVIYYNDYWRIASRHDRDSDEVIKSLYR